MEGSTFAAAAEEDVYLAKGLDGLGDGRLALADDTALRVWSQPCVNDRVFMRNRCFLCLHIPSRP